MIFIAIFSMIALMYFFGLKAFYYSCGAFTVFYIYAIITSRRSPAKGAARRAGQ